MRTCHRFYTHTYDYITMCIHIHHHAHLNCENLSYIMHAVRMNAYMPLADLRHIQYNFIWSYYHMYMYTHYDVTYKCLPLVQSLESQSIQIVQYRLWNANYSIYRLCECTTHHVNYWMRWIQYLESQCILGVYSNHSIYRLFKCTTHHVGW